MKTTESQEVRCVNNSPDDNVSLGWIISISTGVGTLILTLWRIVSNIATPTWVKGEMSELRLEIREDIEALERRVEKLDGEVSRTREDVASINSTLNHQQDSIANIHQKLDSMILKQDKSGTDVRRLLREAISDYNTEK